MGRITERLRKDFRAALKRKILPIEAIRRAEDDAASIGTVDDLIENGRHPLHAVYANVANLINLWLRQPPLGRHFPDCFPDRPETQPHHAAFDEGHSRSIA